MFPGLSIKPTFLQQSVNHCAILGMDTSGTSKSISYVLSFHTLDHLKRIRVTVYQADSKGQQNQSSSLSLSGARAHTHRHTNPHQSTVHKCKQQCQAMSTRAGCHKNPITDVSKRNIQLGIFLKSLLEKLRGKLIFHF